MILSRDVLDQINAKGIEKPLANCFELPEKVLQFGTGVLLRGLPDYFIDKANKKGIFNGRIVVIKSTSSGGADEFTKQNGLYTLCVRGVEGDRTVEENIINASISRVLSAKNDWQEILRCAANPEMQIVISNTTEVGIALTKDNVHASPPESFPGKLLSFLYQRFKVFNGDPLKGMIIIPTELITNNGEKLEAIVLELAHQNGLETAFLDWLETANHFCNSLVDRIVPGKLPVEKQAILEKQFGYHDELMIMCEVYRLWAIESCTDKVKSVLSFSEADEGVVIASDINVFRELKLRLLNGSHTFSCALAYLAGFRTVKQAMNDKGFLSFISNLIHNEIVPSVAGKDISVEAAKDFANRVLDRYRNPHIEHQWLSISVQYSSKMQLRNIPLILKYYQKFDTTPQLMALGFAAYLLFMKSCRDENGKYVGEFRGEKYAVQDDHAEFLYEKWKSLDTEEFVHAVLANKNLWTTDLTELNGFEAAVNENLRSLTEEGAVDLIRKASRTGLQV